VDAAPQQFDGDLGEEPFDQVEPARAGRGEVQMEALSRIVDGTG
jgi:hypothetical protein